ncbi:MAG: PAS domain-containing protein [Nitrospirae bacterium]|nr:PAS domain-containing protein [Nitrospirota bacterium]
MFTPLALSLTVLGYLLLLFVLAYYAEHREKTGRSIVSNPYVYSLSFAVYCTSWTFYGSVGKAATSGLSFLTTYLGPTLMACLWWVVLRKIVGIAKKNRITTISDFIGSRYGNSLTLSALVAVVALVGITPYLGLQIKSISNTLRIMAGQEAGGLVSGWSIALFLGVFSIIFGARRLDASERHEGLIFAIAFESIVKLVAFIAVGAFVTYGLFDGFGDIFGRIQEAGRSDLMTIGGGGSVSFLEWSSLTFLSMMAIMFLPRQFHVAVVENSDERHIAKAMWLFPLYLLLINVFVLPVAFGGLLLGGGAAQADSFVLTIPLEQGQSSLALLVFLGGFSAATGMIIVESLALSTMVMNSLVMPVVYRTYRPEGLPGFILNVKRLVILGCVFLGYFFAVSVGEFYSLVDMGLKSFEAVTLFAPAVFLGLYWKKGNWKGAAAGLLAGFAVWLYTLLVPALMRAGVVGESHLLGRLFGSEYGNPLALFGVAGLDKWTHSLFWSMSLNLLFYFGVSLFTSRSMDDDKQALVFVDSYTQAGAQAYAGYAGGAAGGITSGFATGFSGADEVEELLGRYIGRAEAGRAVDEFLAALGKGREGLPTETMAELHAHAERLLSGAVGSAIATLVMREKLVMDEELSSSIRQMSDRLKLSREELEDANRELSYLKEFSQNIIESVPQGIATLDRDLRVTYWNRQMESITGIQREQAHGGLITDLPICMEPDILAGGLKGGEYTCKRRASGHATIKLSVGTFNDPRGGYILVLEDITEKLRHESELLQASKYASIGKLTAGISHEIGNPLASISSLVQEIQAVDSPEFTRDSLDVVTRHIERIVRIVRSLGDFARLYSKDLVSSNIAEVLEKTLELTRYDKKFRKVVVTKDIEDVPPMKINPDQIQQVFLNLILNALDAMPDGGRLSIAIKKADGSVRIVFRDSGAGMDVETAGKVFDPFFTTKQPGKGTGLGMSICYGIVKEHGGTITVDSAVGRGTEFTITLPV